MANTFGTNSTMANNLPIGVNTDLYNGYFSEAKNKKTADLIRFYYDDREDMFDAHSYNKGGAILHMLRKDVGDEAFFKSLELYLKTNQYKSVEVHNLRLAFEEVTGRDMNRFLINGC
jgi:aminopeptidase N